MSTYTDLQNKIKENIAVDYRNRATPQEVHLLNANNEYWGKFKGSIDTISCTFNNVELSNATITNSVISGNTVMIDGSGKPINFTEFQIEFENIRDDVSSAINEVKNLKNEINNKLGIDTTELSVNIDKLNEQLISSNTHISKNINYLSSTIDSEISNRIKSIENITNIIDSKISTLNLTDDLLSSQIQSEIQERKSDILHINDIISGEIINRAIADQNLGNAISTVHDSLIHKIEHEIQDRISSDNEIKDIFNNNLLSSAEKLSTDFTKSLTEEKHYSIKRFSSTDYIFNIEDYKTNIIETVVDGYSVFCDNILVGKLYNLDNSDFSNVTKATLDIYQNVSSPITILHDTYELILDTPVYCTTEGFKTYSFTLKHINGKLTIEVNGELSKYNIVLDGTVDSGEYCFEKDGKEAKILYIDNYISKFKNFASSYDFNNDNKVITIKDNITTIAELDINNRLINLSDDCVISSILKINDTNDNLIGHIYKQDLIKDNSDNIEKIIISDIDYNYGNTKTVKLPLSIELTKDNNFKSYENLMPHYYATYDINDDKFYICYEQNVYKYAVKDVNSVDLINKNINVYIDLDNHVLSDYQINPTIDSISVELNSIHPELSVANGIYTFNAENNWFITTKDEQQEDQRIWVDFSVDPSSYIITIKLHNKTTGTAVLYYQILPETAEINPDYSYYLINVESTEIGIKNNIPFETYEFAKNTYQLTIDTQEYFYGQLKEKYTLLPSENIQSEIKIDLPTYNKSQNCLAEGIIYICPYSNANNTEAILLFNTNDLVVYNGKYVNQINIPVNVTTQLKFNEVFKGTAESPTVFTITNDSDYMLYKDITALSSKLSNEIENIIEINDNIDVININQKQLSAYTLSSINRLDDIQLILSNEISTLGVNVSNDISNLELTLSSEISTLGVNVSNDISNLELTLSNEISTLGVNVSNEVSTLGVNTNNSIIDLSNTINKNISNISVDLISDDLSIINKVEQLSVATNIISTDLTNLSATYIDSQNQLSTKYVYIKVNDNTIVRTPNDVGIFVNDQQISTSMLKNNSGYITSADVEKQINDKLITVYKIQPPYNGTLTELSNTIRDAQLSGYTPEIGYVWNVNEDDTVSPPIPGVNVVYLSSNTGWYLDKLGGTIDLKNYALSSDVSTAIKQQISASLNDISAANSYFLSVLQILPLKADKSAVNYEIHNMNHTDSSLTAVIPEYTGLKTNNPIEGQWYFKNGLVVNTNLDVINGKDGPENRILNINSNDIKIFTNQDNSKNLNVSGITTLKTTIIDDTLSASNNTYLNNISGNILSVNQLKANNISIDQTILSNYIINNVINKLSSDNILIKDLSVINNTYLNNISGNILSVNQLKANNIHVNNLESFEIGTSNLETIINNYLPLSGGTVTGNISISNPPRSFTGNDALRAVDLKEILIPGNNISIETQQDGKIQISLSTQFDDLNNKYLPLSGGIIDGKLSVLNLEADNIIANNSNISAVDMNLDNLSIDQAIISIGQFEVGSFKSDNLSTNQININNNLSIGNSNSNIILSNSNIKYTNNFVSLTKPWDQLLNTTENVLKFPDYLNGTEITDTYSVTTPGYLIGTMTANSGDVLATVTVSLDSQTIITYKVQSSPNYNVSSPKDNCSIFLPVDTGMHVDISNNGCVISLKYYPLK